jgi:DmsE family decaheme c-type cytochrome
MRTALVGILGLALAGGGSFVARGQVPGAPPAAAPLADGYVGVKRCMSCHEPEAKGYRDSAHGWAWHERSPAAGQGCEGCHGPGKAHVDDVGAKGTLRVFPSMAPREVADTCTTCHSSSEHGHWQGSAHDARNVSCVSCHTIHGSKSETGQLKQASVTATCAQCHRDKAAKLQRSGHMPVREGKMECTTCHNQHGSPNARMLRTGSTINEFCGSCHAEKRGPFLWEHPPVRESCVTCHDPHGSSNDRMLVARTPMLCQRCHIARQHPATVYDNATVTARSSRVIARGCVNCHSNIHGSNHPSGARFQR